MRSLNLIFGLLFSTVVFAQENPTLTNDRSFDASVASAYESFQQGRYLQTRERLTILAQELESKSESSKTMKGLVAYWRGVTANRLSEFSAAINFFEQAINLDYRPKDIYYEYGQALYASEKLKPARRAFGESYKRGHKRGVSLYYLGFISQTLRDEKQAATFYRSIESLPAEEQEGTLQPAKMQMGDMFLSKAEKRPDTIKVVETYVIPYYREALAVEPESKLAKDIQAKITSLQQKYELVLFRMRNGRATPVPPYFLRVAQDFTYDTNPVFAATETTNSEAKQGSVVSKTEAFGRHSFFYKNIMSFAPELRGTFTRHLKREPQIYRNDNWVITPALRTSYEHYLNRKQASLIADVDYSYSNRDRDGTEDLKFNSRVTTYTVGERIAGLFGVGETTVRLRHRTFDSYLDTADSKTNGIGVEHILPRKSGQLYIFNLGYDQTRVESKVFDTNTIFLRGDVILPVWRWKITPQFGFGLTLTDPINNDDRGQERTLNPSVRFSRPLGRGFRLSVHGDYMQNQSKDKANFAYQKTFYGAELEYVF